jgi:hypothetical protein
MLSLKLGIEGLESAEVSRVRILLRLLKGNPEFAWDYATEGPFDALLSAIPQSAQRAAVVIDLLPEGTRTYPGALVRPVAADALETVLMALQSQLQPTVFGDLAPAELASNPVETRLAEAVVPQPRPAPPVVLRSAALPQTTVEAVANLGNEEYKLKRWPPQAVLRDNKDRIRLANLISRKPFTAAQMAQLSGLALADVQAFITVLQSFGIVSVALAAPVASAQRLGTDTCVAPRKNSKRGFLSALRRKLGI